MSNFPNLAHRTGDTASWPAVDTQVQAELNAAGIQVEGPWDFMRQRQTEVPSAFFGTLCRWSFRRAWRYWVAEGPGIPPEAAEAFHKDWGQQVRVDGHCGCPSPLEWFKGFAVGMYHIDTQDGLNAFAALLRSIYKEPGP